MFICACSFSKSTYFVLNECMFSLQYFSYRFCWRFDQEPAGLISSRLPSRETFLAFSAACVGAEIATERHGILPSFEEKLRESNQHASLICFSLVKSDGGFGFFKRSRLSQVSTGSTG